MMLAHSLYRDAGIAIVLAGIVAVCWGLAWLLNRLASCFDKADRRRYEREHDSEI